MYLEIRNLVKRFGGLVAVNDVSFEVRQAEIVGILGPNGSGKTTLLSMIGGLLVPSGGQILWRGGEIQGSPAYKIASAGVVKTFQNPQLFLELTSLENVLIAGHLYLKRALGMRRIVEAFRPGRTPSQRELAVRAEKALEICRLSDVRDQHAINLSYGQEKMLGVAIALMCDPSVLLLDEPASGLGDTEIANLENVLRDLRKEGTALCIIDHKIGFLGRLADRAIALRQGTIIAEGTPDEVLNNPQVIQAYLGGETYAA